MAKILLVEDDNNLREIYGERLMAEGYDIVSAADGEEALQTAVTEKPDLIISDVMMPKISGFDMLDILRQTPETKNVKIIMMTALSQAEDKSRADKLGADKYLVKSQVTLEDVARVVHDLLGDDVGDATPTPESHVLTEGAAAVTSEPQTTDVASPPPAVPTAPPSTEPVVPPAAPAATVTATEPATPVATPATETTAPVNQATVTNTATPAVPTGPHPTEPVVLPAAPPTVAATEPPTSTVPAPTQETATVDSTNPISASQAITATEQLQMVQAQDSQSELNEVAEQIKEFVATSEPATKHQEPVNEPSEQDLIHAQNAAEDPKVVSAQPVSQPMPATIPPVAPLNTGSPEPASARKKVIQPVNGEGLLTPDIHALYEQEMAKEAADSPVANPESGSVVAAPVAEEVVDNPITSASATEDTPPPLETVDVSQIDGVYTSEEAEEEAEAAAILKQAADSKAELDPTTLPPASPDQPPVASAAASTTPPPADTSPSTDPADPNNIAL